MGLRHVCMDMWLYIYGKKKDHEEEEKLDKNTRQFYGVVK